MEKQTGTQPAFIAIRELINCRTCLQDLVERHEPSGHQISETITKACDKTATEKASAHVEVPVCKKQTLCAYGSVKQVGVPNPDFGHSALETIALTRRITQD